MAQFWYVVRGSQVRVCRNTMHRFDNEGHKLPPVTTEDHWREASHSAHRNTAGALRIFHSPTVCGGCYSMSVLLYTTLLYSVCRCVGYHTQRTSEPETSGDDSRLQISTSMAEVLLYVLVTT